MRKIYNPVRIYKIFRVLTTLFLLMTKKQNFAFIKPLKPKDLGNSINALGTCFIKMAQVLAGRSDFFEQEYLKELKKIHDQLTPMSQKELDLVCDYSKFQHFDKNPVASATIAQVHKARLFSGEIVAVKVRRFGIKKLVISDIKIIKFFLNLFLPIFSHYTKNSIKSLIDEFTNTISKEISMQNELHNLIKFSNVYSNLNIKFPTPFVEFCNDDMLVMSYETGFRFDDKENIIKFNINIKKVIENLVLFYVEQMLINGYFHADPHPGNVLIDKNSQIILLDFGMVKLVPNETRIAIISLLKAANEKDYFSYINACKILGISAYETPNMLLAEFVEQVFEIFSNENLQKTTMIELSSQVMQNTQKFPFKLPSEAIYILRVSAIIEGLGTTYIENFNGVKDILPILVKNIPRAYTKKDTFVEFATDEMQSIPQTIHNAKNSLQKLNYGELEINISKQQLSYFKKAISETINSILIGFIFIVTAFFLIIFDKNYALIATIFLILGFIKLLYRKS